MDEWVLLIAVVAVALFFDFTNGFHDAANAIATGVSTRALNPRFAVAFAAVLNFAGAFVSVKVAATIAKGIVDADAITLSVILAGLVGAITWNLITWFLGLPSSSSHALIGGVAGSAIAASGLDVINWDGIWDKVVIEDDVFVGPGVVFTNDLVPRVKFKRGPGEWLPTVVSGGASIGANATIVCGTVIGRNAFIGAGSVVTTDVANHALVVGNPARWVGWVCECGLRLDGELTCRCGRTYEFDGSGLTSK